MGKVLVPTPFITRHWSFNVIKNKFMQNENDGWVIWNNKVARMCIYFLGTM